MDDKRIVKFFCALALGRRRSKAQTEPVKQGRHRHEQFDREIGGDS